MEAKFQTQGIDVKRKFGILFFSINYNKGFLKGISFQFQFNLLDFSQYNQNFSFVECIRFISCIYLYKVTEYGCSCLRYEDI